MRALAIERLVLKSAESPALADFYVRALGFSPEGRDGDRMRLRLGATRLDIEPGAGRPYPDDVPGFSTLFQHLAIATPDMAASYARLQASRRAWTAITRGEPVTLPASSGGVTAFKFRDPEGHPLELIQFPGDVGPPRIDHTAISVADAARSLAWYESLGFRVADRSFNSGPAQAMLDGLEDPRVDVIGLAPDDPTPHLELLAYRAPVSRAEPPPARDDIAATRVVLLAADPPRAPTPPLPGFVRPTRTSTSDVEIPFSQREKEGPAPARAWEDEGLHGPRSNPSPSHPLRGRATPSPHGKGVLGDALGGSRNATPFQDPDGHRLEWDISRAAR